jgi:osmotically-inducible protein OsmY
MSEFDHGGGGWRPIDYSRFDMGLDDDRESGHERGYGAWDNARQRDDVRQRRNASQGSHRWGSPYPYRLRQDRTQEWLLAGIHTGEGPQDYQRSDERIQEDANERLTRHGQLDAGNIQVKTENGEVTLEGTVDSRRDKRMAEDALETIRGVKDIHNRLRVA